MNLNIKNLINDLKLTESQVLFLQNFNSYDSKLFHKLDLFKTEYEKFKTLNKRYTEFSIYLVKENMSIEQMQILFKYYSYGYGLKLIARELNITYSKLRKLFSIFNLEIRKGYNVTTEVLKQFRKEKALNERKLKIGFANPNLQRHELTGIRGIQGYYFNNSLNKYVWLRSTYEYIYAVWLDYHNIIWDVEVKQFKLNDGTLYKPDFFIYENSKLTKIVEIKGYYDSRAYKAGLLDNDLDGIQVCLYGYSNNSITKFLINYTSYVDALRDWKKNRILKI